MQETAACHFVIVTEKEQKNKVFLALLAQSTVLKPLNFILPHSYISTLEKTQKILLLEPKTKSKVGVLHSFYILLRKMGLTMHT